MDYETRNELRRKKLCFTCREPWTPDHRCLGKDKIHYVEVHSEEEEEVEEPPEEDNSRIARRRRKLRGSLVKIRRNNPLLSSLQC